MENPFEILFARLDIIEKMLQQFISTKPPLISTCNNQNPLNIESAAKIVGLAKPTIYSLCSAGKIPHFKKGKRLYFFEQDLLTWIKSGENLTQSGIDQAADNAIIRKHPKHKPNKQYSKEARQKLNDSYVKGLLDSSAGLTIPNNLISPELIETKRKNVILKRTIKKKKS